MYENMEYDKQTVMQKNVMDYQIGGKSDDNDVRDA